MRRWRWPWPGFFGRCALTLASGARTLFGLPAGRMLAAGAAGGLAGTVGEAGLLHFRGAYHDPAMFLPVTLGPLSAALLGAVAVAPRWCHIGRRVACS